ncbi:uncharacterized protein [Phyllobates terribilis]|uniref:uncharacterized protein n=1 Tax=Phyllobates terribilis TaxID=111132 RepID=UPI003CCB69F4
MTSAPVHYWVMQQSELKNAPVHYRDIRNMILMWLKFHRFWLRLLSYQTYQIQHRQQSNVDWSTNFLGNQKFGISEIRNMEKLERKRRTTRTHSQMRNEGQIVEEMSNLRTIFRPNAVLTSFACSRNQFQVGSISPGAPFLNPNRSSGLPCPSFSDSSDYVRRYSKPCFRASQRRYYGVKGSNWTDEKSPYEVLELERDAGEEQIKVSYRRLAKFYHPDVYNGRGDLQDGETAETRFIRIQAAYELLIDVERRTQYDKDNRVNPMKASQAWMDWLMKKRTAFDQRGDMAISAWAEQQQREIFLRARQLSRSKVDPEEERRILAREKKSSIENLNTTLKRHTLVLKKRDLMRKKSDEARKREVSRLLAAEGFELDDE